MATGSQLNVDLAFLDQSRQDLQIVKCVVVGDTGVGKTRLTCSHACGTKYTLQQLSQTHVPTVWAIDHYRQDKEILDRSWCCVDGMNVSLRIWDTFGYHDKDRRFAFGRADVVLLCFSLVRPHTLKSVKYHWVPEIRRLCGSIPIVLCGCQADLRYLYKDPVFTKMEKSPFFREILDDHIISSETGRAIAKEIGAAGYYESSAQEGYGVEDVFLNSIRASLCYKREKHFWTLLGGLKHIRHPLAQSPLCPPKPSIPKLLIPSSHLEQDFEKLLESDLFTDVVFCVRGVYIPAHRACLIIAADVFRQLFLTDLADTAARQTTMSNATTTACIHTNISTTATTNTTTSSTLHLLSPSDLSNANVQQHQLPPTQCASRTNNRGGGGLVEKTVKDTATLLDNEETASLWSLNTSDSASLKGGLPKRELNHPAFKCLELKETEDDKGGSVLQTLVTVSDDISPLAFQAVLHFIYTGKFNGNKETISRVSRAAELIGLQALVKMCNNFVKDEGFLSSEACAKFHREKMFQARELLIRQGLLADVTFILDDGQVAAHKALLVSRCDMMFGMFSYNFRESSEKSIKLPGVSCAAFSCLQEYLYLDSTSIGGLEDMSLAIELIELANRMCLPRMMALIQQALSAQLNKEEDGGRDINEDIVGLLESAQLHNASYLEDLCRWYICCNYTAIYRKNAKLIGKLRPENQISLHKQRWPPLWYLKELDHFERRQIDEQREQPKHIALRRNSDDQESGCLGFCSRRNRRFKDVTNQTAAVATM